MAYRYGVPRTEAERAERHVARFGTTELPPRGTGRLASRNPWIAVEWSAPRLVSSPWHTG